VALSGSRGRAGGQGLSQAWARLRESCQGTEGVGVTALIEHRRGVSGKHPACRHLRSPRTVEGTFEAGWGDQGRGETLLVLKVSPLPWHNIPPYSHPSIPVLAVGSGNVTMPGVGRGRENGQAFDDVNKKAPPVITLAGLMFRVRCPEDRSKLTTAKS
jgi:hypothetical protein